MKLNRIHKFGLAFFVFSLIPAYFVANWRYESQLASIQEIFQKEQALHLSTDKLLAICENNSAQKAEPYDATYRICRQGSDVHARTEHAMAALTEDKAKNEIARYRVFGLAVALFNLSAFALYRLITYFNRGTDQTISDRK